MVNWISFLNYDPLERLLLSGDKILIFFVKRDLLGEKNNIKIENQEISNIINSRQPDGSWIFKSSSKGKYHAINHNLVETYKSLRILVGKYELTKSNIAVSGAAEYIFKCQTDEGDIRGILGNQYMPYYCGAITGFLFKAGFKSDKRLLKAINWLIDFRQADGGWVIPLQALKVNKLKNSLYADNPLKVDKSLPSSHMATEMALRAFAYHPDYSKSPEARKAGELIKSRLFKPDKYSFRKASGYWIKFQNPFWWTTLLSSLDTLYRLGFDKNDPAIRNCLEWFIQNQEKSGLWNTGFNKGKIDKIDLNELWVGYGICKMLKMYFDDE
jgi:hypothetical protein